MTRNVQKWEKERIVAKVLEQSHKCLMKKAIENAVYKNFFRDLKPFAIVNAKKLPSEIVGALEKKYILVDKGAKKK